ncbi:MAG: hypothetical protein HY692_09680 [Cyanobacteria bacterium NC_groundwater_1444_Ag_S-0.65um_54_12]|nr:hypothetical protein [Cyanobacteria bacterium NC_groundwater_1444_Ag_S-0.65um_54_12]
MKRFVVPGLALALFTSGCPSVMASLDQSKASKTSNEASTMPASAAADNAQDGFVHLPRRAGSPLGNRGDISNAGHLPAIGESSGPVAGVGNAMPASDSSPGMVYQEPPVNYGTLGLYPSALGPLVTTAAGVFLYEAEDSWTRLATALPGGLPPAAIVPAASGSLLAGTADGIYQLIKGNWNRVAQAEDIADLDLSNDASNGFAVQEDGTVWQLTTDGWVQQTRLPALLGSIKVLSATESYVLGEGLFERWDGKTWTPLPGPDPKTPVSGLAVRQTGSTTMLLTTTRFGLYRKTADGWVAELTGDDSFYLGAPSLVGARGFVLDIGIPAGHAFSYDGRIWQAAPTLPGALAVVALTPDGKVLALDAVRNRLWQLQQGVWKALRYTVSLSS